MKEKSGPAARQELAQNTNASSQKRLSGHDMLHFYHSLAKLYDKFFSTGYKFARGA
jgi:hypothetical protein